MPEYITLFNDERYQRCNLRPGERLFRYDHEIGGRTIGTLAGVICDGILDCGHSAPYGGIDFTRPRVFAGAVVDLVRGAGAAAAQRGAGTMLVRTRPGYHGENDTAAVFALFGLGATVRACELSLGLETWRYRTVEEYERSLKDSAHRVLHRGLRAGLAFAAAEGEDEWGACYRLLAETRERRGARMSVSFDYVLQLHAIFGDRIAMYRLRSGDALAGTALVYRIAPDRDHVVAWGDDIRHRPDGVMNVLAYHLVRTAVAQGVRLLDLGVSSVGGVPDDGLIQFKRNIGGATGLRFDLVLPVA